MIHNFNDDGFDWRYPRDAGGRPARFTFPQRQIKKIASSRPMDRVLAFSPWSLSNWPSDLYRPEVRIAIVMDNPGDNPEQIGAVGVGHHLRQARHEVSDPSLVRGPSWWTEEAIGS